MPLRYTYSQELEERGISRDSKEYKQAVPWALSWIDKHRTGYGFHIRRYIRRMTFRVQTMAVAIMPTHIELLINPDFAALLPLRHRAGVLIHEVLHIVLNHPQRAARMGSLKFHEDRFVTLAMECAVNTHLQGPDDLPENRVSPNMFRRADNSFFPERRTFDDYYEMFKQEAEASPWMLPAALQAEGWKCEVGIGPDGTDDEKFGNIRPVGNMKGAGLGEIFDQHEGWIVDDSLSADDLDMIIGHEVRQAEKQARAAGKGSRELSMLVDEYHDVSSVPWSSLFHAAFSQVASSTRDRSPMRPNRRTGEPAGTRLVPEIEAYIYVDVSGSMGHDEVGLLLHEAANASREDGVRVWVQQFDDGLIGDPVKLDAYTHPEAPRRLGYGGTSFRPVIADILKNRPSIAFIGTDGWAESTTRPHGIPTMWLLTHDGKEQEWGTHVRLPAPAEAKKQLARVIK